MFFFVVSALMTGKMRAGTTLPTTRINTSDRSDTFVNQFTSRNISKNSAPLLYNQVVAVDTGSDSLLS